MMIRSALIALAATAALLAQTPNPFLGQWELNVAKSKFNPGPAYKSEHVTAVDDKTTVEGTDSDGKPFKWSFAHSPGTAVPIDGMDNSTVVETYSSKTLDHQWKMAGGTLHGHGVLSKDGKTLRYTQTGTDAKGSSVHHLLVFERQ